MSIRSLPQDAIIKIQSSAIITSLNEVVDGLFYNALDAGATRVNINLDYTRGNCTVEDDGLGILPSEFSENGGLAQPHHTSRFPPCPNIHGHHGNFLASIAALSLLSICSRHHLHVSHNSILIHNSTLLSRNVPAPPDQTLTSFDHGTRVIVRDLFGSMPVRVKQRPLGRDSEREWFNLIHNVVATLLSWPSAMTVMLRDSNHGRELRLKAPDRFNILDRISRLLAQASIASCQDSDPWVHVSASVEHISIRGCISERPVASRRCQFISFGIQPVRNEYGNNVLYEEINKAFSNSSFGVVEPEEVPEHDTRPSVVTGGQNKPRKGIERWPMFYVQVRMHQAQTTKDLQDILDNRTQHLPQILALLRAVCYGFLKKHHHRPQKVYMSEKKPIFSMSGTSRHSTCDSDHIGASTRSGFVYSSSHNLPGPDPQPVKSISPFDSWPTAKVGHVRRRALVEKGKHTTLGSNVAHASRLLGQKGQLLRKPFNDAEVTNSKDMQEQSCHFLKSQLQSNMAQRYSTEAEFQSIKEKDVNQAKGKTIRGPSLKKHHTKPSEWIKSLLKSWENPVFENVPTSVARAYNDESCASFEDAQFNRRSRHFPNTESCGVMFESASVRLNGRVAKDALDKAEFISQVDRKFILVRLPLDDLRTSTRSSALAILDQHAVDERCKLEDLQMKYFVQDAITNHLSADVITLEKPILAEFAIQEVELLRQLQGYFASWGVIYQLKSPTARNSTPDSMSTSTIRVTSLPPSIIERCRTEPRVLIDLLRKEAWKLSETGRAPQSAKPVHASASETNHTWVSNFHGCPRGILDLLHSRSCRSAVMFNDVLSGEECNAMIQRLSRCAFPFQCAHGRPSMVPLVDLGFGVSCWNADGLVSDQGL